MWYWAARSIISWIKSREIPPKWTVYSAENWLVDLDGIAPSDKHWLRGRHDVPEYRSTDMKRMTKAEAELDYHLLNVGKNMWLKKGEGHELAVATSYLPSSPGDKKPKVDVEGGVIVFGGFTSELSEALMVKRPLALQQFLVDCRRDATDYNIPVRVVDLVACQLGLES